jgi:hypothetical protein
MPPTYTTMRPASLCCSCEPLSSFRRDSSVPLTAQWLPEVGWVVRCYHVFPVRAPGAGAVGTLELRTGRKHHAERCLSLRQRPAASPTPNRTKPGRWCLRGSMGAQAPGHLRKEPRPGSPPLAFCCLAQALRGSPAAAHAIAQFQLACSLSASCCPLLNIHILLLHTHTQHPTPPTVVTCFLTESIHQASQMPTDEPLEQGRNRRGHCGRHQRQQALVLGPLRSW